MAAATAKTDRQSVLRLYRSLLRTGNTWKSGTEPEEAEYILAETKTLFRKYKDLVCPNEIALRVGEAESRFAVGCHYKIPYPRIYNNEPDTLLRRKRKFRAPKVVPNRYH